LGLEDAIPAAEDVYNVQVATALWLKHCKKYPFLLKSHSGVVAVVASLCPRTPQTRDNHGCSNVFKTLADRASGWFDCGHAFAIQFETQVFFFSSFIP